MKNKFTLLVLTLLLFSCGTTNRSYVYSDLDIKVKTALEAKVDVDMSNKLMGSSSGTYLFGLIKIFGDSKFADGYGGWGRLGKLKSAAAYKAIKRGKGDICINGAAAHLMTPGDMVILATSLGHSNLFQVIRMCKYIKSSYQISFLFNLMHCSFIFKISVNSWNSILISQL